MNKIDYTGFMKEEINMNKKSNLNTLTLNYLPKEVYERTDLIKRLLKSIALIMRGLPQNIAIIGSKGCGKTITIKHIFKELNIPVKYVNCRGITQFLILEELTDSQKSGLPPSTIQKKLSKLKEKIIILDEMDTSSQGKNKYDVLYPLSEQFSTFIIINNPHFLERIHSSTASRLQLERVVFKNYEIKEIKEILDLRIKEGEITGITEEEIGLIAVLTFKHSNSDIRVALKATQYVVTKKCDTVEDCFEQARKDIFYEVIALESLQSKIILKAIVYSKDTTAKEIYKNYILICKELRRPPYSYSYYYQQLVHLQNTGILALIEVKSAGNPRKVDLLIDENIIKEMELIL